MRVVSIAGARPQFVKLAVVYRALTRHADVSHGIVHTGQHYDDAMSASFFRDLSIPAADYNLEVGSGPHGEQTGEMIKRLEPVLEKERPQWVILYGDTNSTLAGAVVASKLHLETAHVEAGLRSFNRRMPEEINRIVADHVSDVLFCPTETGMKNLRNEGLGSRAVLCGDVMYDAALAGLEAASRNTDSDLNHWGSEFALATVHRAENTDDPKRLTGILEGLERVAAAICPVFLPLHPRTRNVVRQMGWTSRHVKITQPIAYLDMLVAESRARLIFTDSGGVQKEAYFVRKPCITLRNETEWEETLANGCNVLVDATDPVAITNAALRSIEGVGPWTGLYGDGNAGGQIAAALCRHRLP
jgi:UDP-GlcNAc3NAcA epimerase